MHLYSNPMFIFRLYIQFWRKIMFVTILSFYYFRYKALVRTTDTAEYHDTYSFQHQNYQLIILTNTDPPSCAMEDYFPVNIV